MPRREIFPKKYPLVHYELFSATADFVRERIDKGLTDIGLLTEPVDLSRYEFLRLKKRDRWGVLTFAGSPLAEKQVVSFKDLRELPLMIPCRQEVQDNLARWFGENGERITVFATYNLVSNAIPMVVQKLCHALTLEYVTKLYDNPSVCFRPLTPELLTTSVLVWKRQQPSSSAVQRFIQEIAVQLSK